MFPPSRKKRTLWKSRNLYMDLIFIATTLLLLPINQSNLIIIILIVSQSCVCRYKMMKKNHSGSILGSIFWIRFGTFFFCCCCKFPKFNWWWWWRWKLFFFIIFFFVLINQLVFFCSFPLITDQYSIIFVNLIDYYRFVIKSISSSR